LVSPGNRSRKIALVEAARPAIRIMYGAGLMFALAAFIEGFWSPLKIFPSQLKYGVGLTLWALVIAYFSFGGRKRGT